MGHSRGRLVFGSKPHTSLGITPLGNAPPQSFGGGWIVQGRQVAVRHAGSSSAILPCAPPSGRIQYSTRFRPGKPTITVPDIVTAWPARTDTSLPSMYAAVFRYVSTSLLPLA